jgi:Uma2 family endonuclease
MSLRKSDQRLTVAEYLEMERSAVVRHEYVGGSVYAMARASDRHNLIAGTLYARLLPTASALGCQAFISDVKLMVDSGVFYYPDVMVCCESTNNDPYIRRKPVLIIEVTSPGTERIDHNEKLLAYEAIETLIEYVLVAQDQSQVEVYRRKDGQWRQPEFLGDRREVLRLESVRLEVTLAEIYSNVRLGHAE